MHISRRTTAAALAAAGLVFAGAAEAFPAFTSVPSAQPKSTGVAAPNALALGLTEQVVARGSDPLDGGTAAVPYYGFDGDGPMVPAPGDTPDPTHNVEATKTEPDKNTYLVLRGQKGADPSYKGYGTHFLFQGHEHGAPGYITRINLDADAKHRVTLMATQDVHGADLPVFDGSTWDPFNRRLLFTAELGTGGGVWQATVGYPSQAEDISGVTGRGGYEGIQNDNLGNLWIVEDVGGVKGTESPHAKQPNSFVYRLVPTDKTDLTAGGVVEALQVISKQTGEPIVFHAGSADADISSQDEADLHTFGKTFVTKWVTLHDTAVDGTAPFDANALAKAAGATPFKRPENGVFRPGTGFRQFFFSETGDTDALTEAGSSLGGFGGIYRLTQTGPGASTGKLRIFYRGDVDHTGIDNLQFASATTLLAGEDAGDTLHTQRNGFDSLFSLNTARDYSHPSATPDRLIALGRDTAATIDSAFLGMAGYQNDGDNEVTGIHVSDGNPGPTGILGSRVPTLFETRSPWRAFYTQQHGENQTFELLSGR